MMSALKQQAKVIQQLQDAVAAGAKRELAAEQREAAAAVRESALQNQIKTLLNRISSLENSRALQCSVCKLGMADQLTYWRHFAQIHPNTPVPLDLSVPLDQRPAKTTS